MTQKSCPLWQKMLAKLCHFFTWVFSKSSSGHRFGATRADGAKSEWLYLMDWGPKMLIVRKGRVQYLMSACATKVVYGSEDRKSVLACRPLLMMLEPGDEVTIGYRRVYKRYYELESPHPSYGGFNFT